MKLMTSLFLLRYVSGICENYCLILYVYIGEVADAGGVLTFYIPMIMDDGP